MRLIVKSLSLMYGLALFFINLSDFLDRLPEVGPIKKRIIRVRKKGMIDSALANFFTELSDFDTV